MQRYGHIFALLCGLFAIAFFLPAQADTFELRGYGKVQAKFSLNEFEFDCETPDKANWLMGKLISDISWDTAIAQKTQAINVKGHSLMVHVLEGYGAILVARSGSIVVAFVGANPDQVSALAGRSALSNNIALTSEPRGNYPVYLDFFDNRAIKAFVHPMSSPLKFGLDSHWPFLRTIGGGEVFQNMAPAFLNPAPGIVQWGPSDYEVAKAEQEGGLVVPAIVGAGEAPFWEYNRHPENMMKVSATAALGEWGGMGMAGGHYESWGMSPDERMQSDLGFLQRVMGRYSSSSAVGGWFVYAGSPGVEIGFHDHGTETWDQSSRGGRSWRNWLQTVQKYDLAELGRRWFGDPAHYSAWEQVSVPDPNLLFGPLDADSFVLRDGWRWRAGATDEKSCPQSDGKDWTSVAMPPVQNQITMTAGAVSFFDVSFDASSWSSKQSGGTDGPWLVFAGDGVGKQAAQVFLNGVSLDMPQDDDSREGPFAVKLGSALRAGANDLCVRLFGIYQTRNGRLGGPVFLVRNRPRPLPYWGEGVNALYSDFRLWQEWAMVETHRDTVKLARQIDPDRPLVLSGAAGQHFDDAAALAADYGMAIEHTGRESWYHPWWSGLGLVSGFYGAGEESGVAKGNTLDRELSWILFDADSSHAFFWDLENYIDRERGDGWFTAHHRLLQMFGKYLRYQPGIVVFRSGESDVVGHAFRNKWDVGRGGLQDAHYDNGYAGERELKSGLLAKYPLLIDSGSRFLEPDTVVALKAYVEAGGTFVAFEDTGLHTASIADASPISALTGFKASASPVSGRLGFAADSPLFPEWRGAVFEGHGRVLQPVAADTVALARWQNGGGVAVGLRKLGAGRVIVIGTSFWVEGRDLAGTMSRSDLARVFFEGLAAGAGVARDADASSPEIWARRMITKNGLQDWLVAVNRTEGDRDADVWMKVDRQPDEVIDLLTNQPVAFQADAGGVRLKNVHFLGYGVRVFGVRRGDLAAALPVWWREKTTYWRRTPAEIALTRQRQAAPAIQPQVVGTLALDTWKYRPDSEAKAGEVASWLAPDYDDSAWRDIRPDHWREVSPPLIKKDENALYRAVVSIPKYWSGERVYLSAYSFDRPIVYDAADFFVNDHLVASYKSHGGSQNLNYDITDNLHPGANVIGVKLSGGADWSGIDGAIWLEARPVLDFKANLMSGWHLAVSGAPVETDAGAGLRAKGEAIVRQLEMPASCAGRTDYLDFSSRWQWVRTIVINGMPISYNSYQHPFGTGARVAITPYIHPGQSNEMKLLSNSANDDIQLDSISVGCAIGGGKP